MSDDARTAEGSLGAEGEQRNVEGKAGGAAGGRRAEFSGDLALGDSVNWAAMSHRELFTAVHRNNEPVKGHELSREWGELAGELEEVTSGFADSVRRSEAGWRGEAAEAARAHLLELAQRGSGLAEAVRGVGERISEESTVVERAKAAMPEPRDFDFDGFLRHAFAEGGLEAFALASSAVVPMVEESNSRHQQAVDVMTRMESESRQVDASTPAFDEERVSARAAQAASGGSGGAVREAAALADSPPREGRPEASQAASSEVPTEEQARVEAARAPQERGEALEPAASVAGGAGSAAAASPSAQTQQLPVLDASAAGHVLSQPSATESAAASAPPTSPQMPPGGGPEAPNASKAMAFGGTGHPLQGVQSRSAAFSQSAPGERSAGWQGTIPRGALRSGEAERGGKNVPRSPAGEELQERRMEFEPPVERGSTRDGREAELPPEAELPVPPVSEETGPVMPPGGVAGALGAGAAGGAAGAAGSPGAFGDGPAAAPESSTPLQPGGSSSAAPLLNQSSAAAPPPAGAGDAGAGNAVGGAYGGMPMGAGPRQGGGEAGRQPAKYLKDQEIVEVPQPSSPQVFGEKFKKKQ